MKLQKILKMVKTSFYSKFKKVKLSEKKEKNIAWEVLIYNPNNWMENLKNFSID